MQHSLNLYNTLTKNKELFVPQHSPFAGMYVCGPTVYGFAHLGHARPAITFDLLFRYLKHLGYKVRYVRNITDVGHLENDADEGDDKILKKARLEQLEPMEIVQLFSESYHHNMYQLNCLSPSIEPRASGHILEQIEMIEKIMKNGFAYEVDGSVYFDVEKYSKSYNYGILSGRKIEDLVSNTRTLEGQEDKRNSFDFALWKKAKPEHIMRWKSVWSEGFPGWHLECSAMSKKYLGEQFDIHGGGMDLMFPHHECEIAQSLAANGIEPVKYWIHNNMITINGQKMGKSLGNFITLNEFFSGSHTSLSNAYTPMTIRFFILQAHYRSTVDFSNEALQASQKGFSRLMSAVQSLEKIKCSEKSSIDVNDLKIRCYEAMNDDLNSPIAISVLFDGVRIINSIHAGNEKITSEDLSSLKDLFHTFVFEIFGLQEENQSNNNNELTSQLIELLLKLRLEAKYKKDFATSDKIRNELNNLGVEIRDKKEGFEWEIKTNSID